MPLNMRPLRPVKAPVNTVRLPVLASKKRLPAPHASAWDGNAAALRDKEITVSQPVPYSDLTVGSFLAHPRNVSQ